MKIANEIWQLPLKYMHGLENNMQCMTHAVQEVIDYSFFI